MADTKPLENGQVFIKLRDGFLFLGSPQKKMVKVDLATHQLTWRPEKKDKVEGKIDFSSINEIREGQETDRFKKKPKPDLKDRSFSVIYGGNNQSLDLIADTAEIQQKWVAGLRHLKAQAPASGAAAGDQFLRRAWDDFDKNKDGKFDIDEIMKLLKSLNVSTPKKVVQKSFEKYATDKHLDFPGFEKFYADLKTRSELVPIFDTVKDGDHVTIAKFKTFAKDTQKTELSDDEVKDLFKMYGTDADSSADKLSFQGFSNYIASTTANSIFDQKKIVKYQDMSQPIAHYWINSSHNTYLLEDQLKGPSSVEAYVRAFRLGCRCVELDCWDGDNGEPVIYHGHTLTSKILFKDVIEACKKYAFEASEYPVILSLENHCSVEQQTKMAEYMTSILGDAIYTEVVPDDATGLPAPESLKNRFLIKGKALPKAKPEEEKKDEDYETEDSSSSESEPEEAKKLKKENGKQKHKVKISPQLSKLIVCCRNSHFKDWETSKEKGKVDFMSSFGESKSTKFATEETEEYIVYNRKQLSRVYPAGGRVDSSNYNPCPHYVAGCQIVALNYQTLDRPMQLLLGKFQENGNTGWILKPEYQRKDGGAKTGPKELTITVISAQQLPKPDGSKKGEVIDPYIEVEAVAIKEESNQTPVINDNGFNPVWTNKNEFNYKIDTPDCTMIRFCVKESDVGIDDFIATYSVPFSCLKEGYRSVPLYDAKHNKLELSSLFVKVEIK